MPQTGHQKYLLGTPCYRELGFSTREASIIPVGQLEQARLVSQKTGSEKVLIAQLKKEYLGIMQALEQLNVEYQILNIPLADPDLQVQILKLKVMNLELYCDAPNCWYMYPRDMFVYLEKAAILLVHSDLFQLKKRKNSHIRHSLWAEGGRVVFSGRKMLIGSHPETPDEILEKETINLLEKRGMQTGVIPYPLAYRITPDYGKTAALFYDTHIDRVASLLTNRDGGYHLILDPGYRTGPLLNPWSAKESVDRVRRVCDDMEIRLHLPGSLTVPYAASVMQFNSRQILCTAGDEEILKICNLVAGPENVAQTGVQLCHYPVFVFAGLHCLITERPEPLIFDY